MHTAEIILLIHQLAIYMWRKTALTKDKKYTFLEFTKISHFKIPLNKNHIAVYYLYR